MASDKSSRFTRPEATFQTEETATDAADLGAETGPAAMGRLQRQLEELTAAVQLYMAARMDAVRARARHTAMVIVVAMVVGFILLGTLITCAVISVLGIAELVGQALGDRMWAGNLITGLGLLAIVAIAMLVTLWGITRGSRERTVEKYARQRQE